MLSKSYCRSKFRSAISLSALSNFIASISECLDRSTLELFPSASNEVINFVWAASWQNLQNEMCGQQRLRSAWVSAWVLSYPSSTAKTQISLGIQLIGIFAGCTDHFVGFVMRWLIYHAYFLNKPLTQQIHAKLTVQTDCVTSTCNAKQTVNQWYVQTEKRKSPLNCHTLSYPSAQN